MASATLTTGSPSTDDGKVPLKVAAGAGDADDVGDGDALGGDCVSVTLGAVVGVAAVVGVVVGLGVTNELGATVARSVGPSVISRVGETDGWTADVHAATSATASAT